MVNIIITGSNSTLDNGEAALLVASVDSMNKLIPHAHYVVGSVHQEVDEKRYGLMLPNIRLRIITGTRAQSRSSIRAILLLFRYIPEYARADIGVDISGDGFGDLGPYGILGTFSHASQLLLGVVLRKPVVVYAQSIGPFKTWPTKSIARFVLNRTSLITVREDITKAYLRTIGVHVPPIHLTADPAFLLDPSPTERINEMLAKEGITNANNPLIGVSISQLIYLWALRFSGTLKERYAKYLDIMARFIDHLVEDMNATIIVVCQTTGAQARHDDRIAANLVHKRIRHKEKVRVLSGDYTPAELKGIVGQCHMFIGSKMHSTIASTSMLVPTVSIAYSHKVHGILGRMLGQEKAIIDIRKLDFEKFLQEILSKSEYVWSNRVQIKQDLKERMVIVRERASLNAELVKTLLDSKRFNRHVRCTPIKQSRPATCAV